MRKKYVLDISVLIQRPEAVLRFGENEVILPAVTLAELNRLKQEGGEEGEKARSVLRLLERAAREGTPESSLEDGVPLKNGGALRVEKKLYNIELPEDLPESKSDNRMLKVCKGLSLDSSEPVILVTENIFLRVAAQVIGLQAETLSAARGSNRAAAGKERIKILVPEEGYKGSGARMSERDFLMGSKRGRC